MLKKTKPAKTESKKKLKKFEVPDEHKKTAEEKLDQIKEFVHANWDTIEAQNAIKKSETYYNENKADQIYFKFAKEDFVQLQENNNNKRTEKKTKLYYKDGKATLYDKGVDEHFATFTFTYGIKDEETTKKDDDIHFQLCIRSFAVFSPGDKKDEHGNYEVNPATYYMSLGLEQGKDSDWTVGKRFPIDITNKGSTCTDIHKHIKKILDAHLKEKAKMAELVFPYILEAHAIANNFKLDSQEGLVQKKKHGKEYNDEKVVRFILNKNTKELTFMYTELSLILVQNPEDKCYLLNPCSLTFEDDMKRFLNMIKLKTKYKGYIKSNSKKHNMLAFLELAKVVSPDRLEFKEQKIDTNQMPQYNQALNLFLMHSQFHTLLGPEFNVDVE